MPLLAYISYIYALAAVYCMGLLAFAIKAGARGKVASLADPGAGWVSVVAKFLLVEGEFHEA